MDTNKQESYILPECCNKCVEADGFLGAKGCSNRTCECHQESQEPRHRSDENGKYRLKNGDVLVVNLSFDTKDDAEAWGNWNNFNRGNTYTIVKV